MNIKKTMKKFIFILALALSQFSSAQSEVVLLTFQTNEFDIAMFDSNDQQIGHTIDEDEIYFEVSLSENYTIQIEELAGSTFRYAILSLPLGPWSILDQGIISSSTTSIYNIFTVEFVDDVDVYEIVEEPVILPWQNGFPGEEGVPFDAEFYNAIKNFGNFLSALEQDILIIKKDDVSDFSLVTYPYDDPFVIQSYNIQDVEEYLVWYYLNDQDYELNVNYLSELSTGWGIINISGDSHEIIGEGLIENTTTTLTSNISVLSNDNGEEEEENTWDDNFPGAPGVSFDMDSFTTEIQLVYELINSDSTNMVLVLENTEQNISVTSASGAVLEPTTFDEHFLVFGVIEDNQQYTILVDENENLDIGWGLFLPVTEEIVVDGVITSEGDVLNGMFTVSTSLSLEEQTTPLKVYNTTYFTLLGKKVKTLDKGLYIKVMQTNKGQVAEKVYHSK
jgi:hypothetical protein